MSNVGKIVISKQGRDKKKPSVIVQEIDENYVLIVDGKYHKIQNPKKKNIKHLQKTNKKIIISEKQTKDLESQNKKIYDTIQQEISKNKEDVWQKEMS